MTVYRTQADGWFHLLHDLGLSYSLRSEGEAVYWICRARDFALGASRLDLSRMADGALAALGAS